MWVMEPVPHQDAQLNKGFEVFCMYISIFDSKAVDTYKECALLMQV